MFQPFGSSYSVTAVVTMLIVMTNTTRALSLTVQIFSLRAAVLVFFCLDWGIRRHRPWPLPRDSARIQRGSWGTFTQRLCCCCCCCCRGLDRPAPCLCEGITSWWRIHRPSWWWQEGPVWENTGSNTWPQLLWARGYPQRVRGRWQMRKMRLILMCCCQ